MNSLAGSPGAAAPPVVSRPPVDYARFRVVGVRQTGQILGSAVAAILIVLAAHSLLANPRWGWPVFAQWFFSKAVLAGLGRTLMLTAAASSFGFLLGTGLALARISRSPLLSGLAWAYIWLLRSIPLLVLLLILFNLGYLYQSVELGIPLTDVVFAKYKVVDLLGPFSAAVLGLSLNQAAFSAEIIRGGILSVDQGQLEAAAALGLSRRRQIVRIVLPQAMRSILPTGFNEIIGLAKNTSVVYVLALPELFYTVQVVYQRNMEVIPLLMVATVWYLVIMTVLSVFQSGIERHFARGAVRVQPPTLLQTLLSWTRRGRRRSTSVAEPSAAVAKHPTGRGVLVPFRQAGEVQLHAVSKSYGSHLVLNGVDLLVRAGEVVAILGPSGSGKSTLLRTINHLEKVDRGFVSLDGDLVGYRQHGDVLYELKERDILKRRAEIGMVFQNFNLFPHMTVLDNIIEAPIALGMLTRRKAADRAHELLARVGLGDKADAYPRQLSGGQQQRVAIARALALRPKVLLFDEPTSALDPELVGEVLDVIKELARSGTTMIIVTHEIGFAREVADTAVFMDGGEILEMGPPAQVLTAPRHRRAQAFLAKVL